VRAGAPAAALPPPGPRLGLAAAPAVFIDPGGLRAGRGVALSASLLLDEHFGAGLSALVPIGATEIGTRGELANVWYGVVTLAARAAWAPRDLPWRAAAEVGPGLLWIYAAGSASPPFVARNAFDVPFAPSARGELGYAATRALALVSAFELTVPVRDVRLGLLGQEPIDTRALIALSLGLEVSIGR
jgi:hypothetical protein